MTSIRNLPFRQILSPIQIEADFERTKYTYIAANEREYGPSLTLERL